MRNRGQLSYVWMMIALALTLFLVTTIWIIFENSYEQSKAQYHTMSKDLTTLTTLETMLKFGLIAVLGGSFLYSLVAGQHGRNVV